MNKIYNKTTLLNCIGVSYFIKLFKLYKYKK